MQMYMIIEYSNSSIETVIRSLPRKSCWLFDQWVFALTIKLSNHFIFLKINSVASELKKLNAYQINSVENNREKIVYRVSGFSDDC